MLIKCCRELVIPHRLREECSNIFWAQGNFVSFLVFHYIFSKWVSCGWRELMHLLNCPNYLLRTVGNLALCLWRTLSKLDESNLQEASRNVCYLLKYWVCLLDESISHKGYLKFSASKCSTQISFVHLSMFTYSVSTHHIIDCIFS